MILGLILAVLLLALLVWIALRPTIVKPILRKIMKSPQYEPLDVAQRHTNYTLYAKDADPKRRDLIVMVIGGAFLIQSISSYYGVANQLYTSMSRTHDVLVVGYPVRFSHTIQQAMLSLNDTLANVAMPYKACHFIGFSAGALLAGTFIRKELNQQISRSIDVPQIGLRVDSMTSVCGLLYSTLNNNALNLLFGYYILHKTPSSKSYHAQALNIPTLIISCTNDILYQQALRYIQSEQCETKIFNERLSHIFVEQIDLPEAKIAVKRIIEFIGKSTTNG